MTEKTRNGINVLYQIGMLLLGLLGAISMLRSAETKWIETRLEAQDRAITAEVKARETGDRDVLAKLEKIETITSSTRDAVIAHIARDR